MSEAIKFLKKKIKIYEWIITLLSYTVFLFGCKYIEILDTFKLDLILYIQS